MVEVMADLGRTGNLTTDIYPLVKKKANDLGETLGETWEATVRARLEENSSDCPGSWNGQYDLFELREKGSGNWVLRNLSETSILNFLSIPNATIISSLYTAMVYLPSDK